MVKSSIVTVIILIAVFIGSLRLSEDIQSSFLFITDSIKKAYIHSIDFISDSIDSHFDQKSRIEELKQKLLRYENLDIKYQNSKSELESLLYAAKNQTQNEIDIQLSRVISYVQLGDFHRVWVDFKRENSDKIYGLIQDGYAAGVVVNSNGRSLGLLNGAEKCSYSVYVGDDRAPGIVRSNSSDEEVLVDFIPSWMSVNPGDIVKTSGLDDIFFEGIEVGVVKEIKKSQGYKIATITPYADILHPKYFWVIKEGIAKDSSDLNITSIPLDSVGENIKKRREDGL